jgi:hypothetical protein
MAEDRWAPYAAAAGAVAIVLFLTGGLIVGEQPPFDAPGTEVAAYVEDNRTAIQLDCALNAAAAPLLLWFLTAVASLARAGGPGTRRAGVLALGSGVAYVAVFLVDNAALAVSALRPENLAAEPELAAALRDFEWLSIAMAAPIGATILAAFAVISLRDGAIWPRWLGWLAAVAAVAYLLRLGVLFTTEGPFSARGPLGLWVPVGALAGWLFVASLTLALRLRGGIEPAELAP